MIQATAFLIYVLVTWLLPMIVYRLRNRRMALYCYQMIYLPHARKAFFTCVLITEVCGHYIYHRAFYFDIGIMFSTVIVFACCNGRLLEKTVRHLRDNRWHLFALFVADLILAFIPYMLTFAMAVQVIIMAAVFYPSERIRSSDRYYYLVSDDDDDADDINNLIDDYFR